MSLAEFENERTIESANSFSSDFDLEIFRLFSKLGIFQIFD